MTQTGVDVADVEAILQFSDDSARKAAFDHYWNKLGTASSSRIDLVALKLCIRLLPSQQDQPLYEILQNFVLDQILFGSNDTEYQYLLAEICFSNAQLGYRIFSSLTSYIAHRTVPTDKNDPQLGDEYGSATSTERQNSSLAVYIDFIRCSFWLPPAQRHYITADLISALVGCIGIHGLDQYAHEALSAMLHLLAKPYVVIVDRERGTTGSPTTGPIVSETVLSQHIIDGSLFSRFSELPSEYFAVNAGTVFRTWFQWITHATEAHIPIDAIHSSFYWATLRTGLLTGFADQQKYCLGILRQSLILSSGDIDTSYMQMEVNNRVAYISQYDRFSTLFETIVLDRYANQVLACLPELTALLGPGSLISPSWSTALLSAALNPKVQDGIRKPIGNWYLENVINGQSSIASQISFFLEGFLPWATQGNLYTSSLISSRSSTFCTHGSAVSKAIARLIVAMPTDSDSRKLLSGTFLYILDTGGKIFSPSILYLLGGFLEGLKLRPFTLNQEEMQMVLRMPRIPSLPEISRDLLTVYSVELSNYTDSKLLQELPGYESLRARYSLLAANSPAGTADAGVQSPPQQDPDGGRSLQEFIDRLHASQHKMIQNEKFVPACDQLLTIFHESKPEPLLPDELFEVLDALWEEAERLEYPRPVIIKMPAVFFHPTCIRTYVLSHTDSSHPNVLVALLQKMLKHMQRLTEGRSYLLSALTVSLRKACFLEPQVMTVLQLEEFFVQFINNPPLPKKEFLFEVVAAQNLESVFPHRNYASYYGQREWHGYAAIVDILTRFPKSQLPLAKRVLDRILEPWRTQEPPIPIISKWKNILQLQTMLLLTESCISDADADIYLDAFMYALVRESWPRYRFLLEWIITRIYYRFPIKAERILTNLSKLNENSPAQIASLMKFALLAAPFLDSEEFALKLMIQLIPFSASPKVQIRHEAHWAFPTIFRLAEDRGWQTVTENAAFQALDKHIRGFDKFTTPPLTIRTLKLDAVNDFNLTTIFQGQYLSIETPELERVAYEDFRSLYADDQVYLSELEIPTTRVSLGDPIPLLTRGLGFSAQTKNGTGAAEKTGDLTPAFLQTKSGFDIASLLPFQGPPSAQKKRPASIILVASLIDNPTNLGGLSRISESFGLEALYIDDLKKTAHKDFKATSVTSEKHFSIRELGVSGVPEFLISMKREGYEVVGIEQTDRSGMLGKEEGGKGVGTLPQKCVLVLGSEKGGITTEVLAALDRCVEIKTVGVTRSLNVQTAGGIAVYEWWREWNGKDGESSNFQIGTCH